MRRWVYQRELVSEFSAWMNSQNSEQPEAASSSATTTAHAGPTAMTLDDAGTTAAVEVDAVAIAAATRQLE